MNMAMVFLRPTYLYDEAQRRLDELLDKQHIIEKRLEKGPEGKIHIVNSKGRVQYYVRTDPSEKSGKYLSKQDSKKLRMYLQKKNDEETLKLIKKEIASLDELMRKATKDGTPFDLTLKKLFSDYPNAIKQYIKPMDISDEDFAKEWLNESYEGKPIPDVGSIQRTEKGEVVRSKSELNIANALYRMGVPYKYEHPLVLANGHVVYPDFTGLNVRKRKVIYWEHRGMMDDREYCRNAVFKNKEYMKSGIVLGDNFVITEETTFLQLGTEEIENVIKTFFLK